MCYRQDQAFGLKQKKRVKEGIFFNIDWGVPDHLKGQSQSGAVFCHLNDHCVVFKSAKQVWKKSLKYIYFF